MNPNSFRMIKWKSRHILATLALILTFVNQCYGGSQGVFEVRLNSFSNLLHKSADGHCCQGFRTISGECSQPCETRFRVCLKHYQKVVKPSEECTFGERLTPVIGEKVQNYGIIAFPLDFKWPGTFSLIIEAWHETNTSDNVLISRLTTQNHLDAGSKWTEGTQNEAHMNLQYEYRMVCSSHYYGKDCDTLCRPRHDQFGHYTCGPNGEKKCMDGWQKDPTNPEGDYCTKAKCRPGCHPENGDCERPGQCKCKTGWTGRFCDRCVLYPGCVHGSCSKPYECRCDEGWGGLFCNQDLNYCTNHRPCQNGATCRNAGQGSYTCSCTPGYTGTNCEKRISNECSHQPCLNGGTCQSTSTNDYTCVCPLGHTGRHCERQAQKCSDNPCKNNGYCTDTSNGYQCTCPNEYHGVNCETKLDHCRAAPCQNGGTCQLDNSGVGQCKCPTGFTGKLCEVNVNDCESNPCKNGGTCFDFVNDYKCYCHAGFTGTNCEINNNDCKANPCANGGTCHDQINDFVCTCKPGFTGKDCSAEVNECASNPCLHGFCINKFNDFECKCLPGYTGKHCNVLPNGNVLKFTGEDELNSGHWALIVTCSVLIPVLVILAVVYIICNKRRLMKQRRKENEEAERQNELNAQMCSNKTKNLDVVNPLDYPAKPVNVNPNIALPFSGKDSAYAKALNTEGSASLLCHKLDSSAYSGANSCANSAYSGANSIRDNASEVSSSSGSSSCKEFGLPTASSIAAISSNSSPNSKQFYYSKQSNKKMDKDNFDLFATEV